MPRRSENERAEGLRATKVATPLGELQSSHRCGVAVSLAGSMRRMVAIRENGLCRRQTDDEHSDCVLTQPNVRPRFCVCGYYELCAYTDESSAARTISRQMKSWNETLAARHSCVASPGDSFGIMTRQGFANGFVGLAATIPHS
jgi:hypothetical protein